QRARIGRDRQESVLRECKSSVTDGLLRSFYKTPQFSLQPRARRTASARPVRVLRRLVQRRASYPRFLKAVRIRRWRTRWFHGIPRSCGRATEPPVLRPAYLRWEFAIHARGPRRIERDA